MKSNFSENQKFLCSDKVRLFDASITPKQFKSRISKERKFKVENLFEFKRITGDLTLSIIFLLFVVFLLIYFNSESGWSARDLNQKRVGKILKQQWVGPLMCMVILLPATILNTLEAFKAYKKSKRLLLPNKIMYEMTQWIRSLEFILYFLVYTFSITVLGYLISTLIFAVFLTYRLGYRTKKWIFISLFSSFIVVLIFRTILQIKTPVNIWLYKFFPENLEVFMKIYF
tara:strand:- start:207 stop:893 length:687 start_codon:yes stop_codon:yes gene_type:complete